MRILGQLRKLLSNKVIVISDPFSYGSYWAYIFGGDSGFERRLFRSQSEAINHQTEARLGLSLAAAFVSLKYISVEQARAFESAKETWCE